MSTDTVATLAPAQTTWSIDASHSHAEFAVRHLMISTVKGRIGILSGTVRLDETDLSTSGVEVTLDIASIDTREAQRDAHLRSADFFDAAQFPAMTFTSRRIADVSADRSTFTVIGDLTIHGVTREVPLSVTAEGRGKDPWGGERAGFSAHTRIKRSDFGLTWNQALETGGFVVGDEVKIALDVEAVRS